MYTTSDAKILVTILSATLTYFSERDLHRQGRAQYIAFNVPDESASAAETCDVLLILCIGIGNGAFEMPLDLARAITVSTVYSATRAWCSAAHRFVFDDSEISVELAAAPKTTDDVELFESVLVGYDSGRRGAEDRMVSIRNMC